MNSDEINIIILPDGRHVITTKEADFHLKNSLKTQEEQHKKDKQEIFKDLEEHFDYEIDNGRNAHIINELKKKWCGE